MLVPSMFIVAPRGHTKLVTSSDTFKFFSTLFIVRGSVAALELVEKASIWAGKIAFKNFLIVIPVLGSYFGQKNSALSDDAKEKIINEIEKKGIGKKKINWWTLLKKVA